MTSFHQSLTKQLHDGTREMFFDVVWGGRYRDCLRWMNSGMLEEIMICRKPDDLPLALERLANTKPLQTNRQRLLLPHSMLDRVIPPHIGISSLEIYDGRPILQTIRRSKMIHGTRWKGDQLPL